MNNGIMVGSIIAFLYGTIIGSFLEVIIYRVPLSLNIAKGRSYCPNCNTKLKPQDLIPLLSWITLRGKCRYCKTKIGKTAIVLELIMGITFVIMYIKFGFSIQLAFYLVFFALMLVISVIDIKEFVVYNSTLYFGYLIAGMYVAYAVLSGMLDIINISISVSIATGAYALLHIVSKKIYGKEAFGSGDIHIMLISSAFIKPGLLYFTIFLPFIVSVICIIFMKIFKKDLEGDSMLPFGPFICISSFLLVTFEYFFANML